MKRKICDSDFVKFEETPLKRQPFAPVNNSAMYMYPSPVGGDLPQNRGELPHNRGKLTSPSAAGPSRTADAELRRVMDNFVGIYEQLDKCGGADVKPNYSYTELAYLAMLRSPNFCLPITEIYRYIQSRFLFFKNSTRKHWKNAVRHSLAKTLCFSKIPVGRGTSNSETLSRSTYLWCILPNSIASFARGDYRPSVDRESGTNTLRWGYYRVNAGKFWDEIGRYVAKKMLDFKTELLASADQARIFETQVCSLPDPQFHPSAELPRQPSPQQLQPQQAPRLSPYQSTPNSHRQCYTHSSIHAGRHTLPDLETSPTCTMPRFDPASPSLGMRGPELGHVEHSQPHTALSQHHDTWVPKLEMRDIDTHVPCVESHFESPFAATDRLAPQFETPIPHSRHFTSPGSHAGSFVTSDRRTPPLTSFDFVDSGNETCASSPENGYYDDMPSCRQIISSHSSPVNSQSVTFDKFTDQTSFENIQLSPMVDSGFLNISDILPHSFSQSHTSDSGCSSLNFDSPCASNGFQYQFAIEPLACPLMLTRRGPSYTSDMLQGLDPMMSDVGLQNF